MLYSFCSYFGGFMKKFFLTLSVFLFTTVNFAIAIEVNENELRSVGEDTIRFENYTGPHSVIESVSAIQAIGSGLGNQVSQNVNSKGTFGNGEKYSVIHAIDENETGKLDADIILINQNATVDHIVNLRRIIASYLQAAYGYTPGDASTVATFVTVYNAVYRTRLDYFGSKYKNVVLNNLSQETCGLSTRWNEWPGNSQIVIPLGDLTSNISAVDTSVISDKNVVESMQEEDDKGVDERKNMVDIKEREAEQATQRAQEEAQKAAEESRALTEQREVQRAAEEEAQQRQEEARQDPTNEEKQQAAQEASERAQEEAQKTQEQEQIVEEAQQNAAQAQQTADRKQSEAQAERTQIARDQETVIQQQIAESTEGNSVIGLKITDSAKQLSAMVKLNVQDGSTIRESPVTVVRGRTILPVRNAVLDADTQNLTSVNTGAENLDTSLLYMAICGENINNGAVKLCLLDAYKMEIQKESKENVAENSVLVNNGNDYYCVIDNGGTWVVGKYDKSLNLLLRSPVAVSSETPIIVTEQGLVVSAANGQSLLLKLSDLSSITNLSQMYDDAK